MGDSVATPAQGAPAPATQAPASAQGQGAPDPTGAGKGDGFNWGLFPNIPEAHRELLQPHLRDIQGHITRMEQQYAPYKDLMTAVPGEQVQDLLGFLNNYSSNPLQTWLGLAQSLQEGGHITNPEFDMQALTEYLSAQQPQAPADPDMPPWAQEMQQMLMRMQQAEEARQSQAQQQQAAAEAQQQQQLLGQANQAVRQALVAAGIPDGGASVVTDQDLNGLYIAHNGDVDQVIQRVTAMRDGFVGTFAQQNGGGSKPPTISGSVPAPPDDRPLSGRKGDPFRQASMGAEQFLRQSNAANGQQ